MHALYHYSIGIGKEDL